MRYPSPIPLRRATLFLAGLIAAACSSGGDGGTNPGPTPTIALSLASSSASVVQGGSAQVGATLTRGGGFTGTVALIVEGAPTGVTGAVSNIATSGGTTTATVTVTVAAATAPGLYSLTVRGTGAGVSAATAVFALTVTAAPDYSLSISPASASLVQGASSTPIAVTINRTNFTSGVTLSLAPGSSAVPAGVTAAFTPPVPESPTASLVLTVAAAAAPGTYNLTVSGTGAPGARSTPFTLTITAAGSFSLAVTPAGAVTVAQGGSDNSKTIAITRVNYTENITLSAEGLPAGVSASFAPNPAGQNSSVLTLTATGAATIGGPVTVTIRGTGPAALLISGGEAALEATATLQLSVKAPGSFAVSVAPPGPVTVFQGASDNSRTVTIARTSYPAPVTLSAENLPVGLTAAFAGNPVSGTSSVMTLTANASVMPGNYTITIRGTGPVALRAPGGVAAVEATTTLAVTIATLGSFGMTLSPACAQGITLSQTELDESRIITFSRTNFPVGIQLTAEGLPAGMTATFSPNPATGNTARMSLTAGQSTPVGNYTVTVRGSGPASLKAPGARAAIEATATLPVTVTAETPDLLDLDYPFNSDLEHWLPGLACATTFQGDWGYVSWAPPGFVQFDGVGNIGSPNAWISKLQSIPATAHTLQFDAAGFIFPGSDAVLRVRIVDAGVSTTLFDQVIVGAGDPPAFSTKQVDIRPWAGKTVRIYFEQDANPPNSHEHLFVDNIRILSGLSNAWQYRKQLTISTGAVAAPAGYSIAVQLDHAALVAAGKSLASGDDVRIVYSNGTVSYELDRRRERGSAFNTATTRIWFATQAAIPANQLNGEYYLYYGNPAAGVPPTNRLRVFLFEDDFENGGLSRWSQFPAGAWVADNSRAHDGAFSVKYAAETQGGKVMLPNLNVNTADVYVESWWYLDSPSTAYKMNMQLRNQANGNVYQANLNEPPFGWGIGKLINPTFTQLVVTPGAPPVGSWIRVGAGIHGSTMRLFVNGTEVAMTSGLTQLGAGQVGLGKFEIPAGGNWWVDDFVARRYVFPEPGSALGSEQGGPFAAGSWMLIRG